MSLLQHLEKLRHFSQLTEFSSIREASQAIGISQTGLSKSLTVLEDVLETRLFLRSREGLKLTKEGLEVLETSKSILASARGLEMRLRSLKGVTAPQVLKIGLYDSIAVYFFSELNQYLGHLYPRLRLELTVDSSAALLARIKQGELDLAIGVGFEKLTSKRFAFYQLFLDSYSFYLSPRVTLQSDTPLLIHDRAEDSKSISVETHLQKLVRSRGCHRVLNFETLKTLTLQGLGIGVLPTQVAKPMIQSGQLINVDVVLQKRHFGEHAIGFLAQASLLEDHGEFVKDLYRLGEDWSTGVR